MKFHVHEEEWYPVLTLVSRWDDTKTDFTDEELTYIRRVEREFQDVQALLAARSDDPDYYGRYAPRKELIESEARKKEQK